MYKRQVLGLVLQRSRFCFYCHARDWFEGGKPRGLLAILLALAVGLVGYTVVLGSWLPVPAPGKLPPDMHIGPVSWVLVLAGLAFGSGMVVSGSCISAHWYRPVSYTHLDVYKRQSSKSASTPACMNAATCPVP